MPMPIKNLEGKTFGRLKVLKLAGRNQYKQAKWLCLCSCGKEKVVQGYALTRGSVKSCGCYQRESIAKRNTTHGMRHTAEYKIWMSIKFRCLNENCENYKYYGGRGIEICDRWLGGSGEKTGFECFFSDMGPRPSSKLSIDRIDNDGNYEPENCRWATVSQQNKNRRKATLRAAKI